MSEDEISIIKKKLKKVDWSKVSNCWEVRFRKNQYSNYKIIELDPNKECSQINPLYKHKKWVEHIYYNKIFDMTDEKLAKLCNNNKHTANYWRKKNIILKEKRNGEKVAGLIIEVGEFILDYQMIMTILN